MKKKVIGAAAVLTLTLQAGCGAEEEGPILLEPTDLLTEEQSGDEPFGFEDLSGWVFYLSSGVGAWYTELSIDGDGSVRGHYQDADLGDGGETYPNGTLYVSDFTGRFEELEKVDEFTYKMKLYSVTCEQEPEKEEIIDGVRYVYSTACGLDGGEDFYLYLPGAKVAELPEEYLRWVGYYNPESIEEKELPFFGLYNVNTQDGFSGSLYEEQSLSEKIAGEISLAEERSVELEAGLQSASTQTDMTLAATELFRNWDDTLNNVWKLLEAELDNASMETLRAEEREWIAAKEAEVEAAGQTAAGGSMQPMAEAMRAAELTKERVYELAEYAE